MAPIQLRGRVAGAAAAARQLPARPRARLARRPGARPSARAPSFSFLASTCNAVELICARLNVLCDRNVLF